MCIALWVICLGMRTYKRSMEALFFIEIDHCCRMKEPHPDQHSTIIQQNMKENSS